MKEKWSIFNFYFLVRNMKKIIKYHLNIYSMDHRVCPGGNPPGNPPGGFPLKNGETPHLSECEMLNMTGGGFPHLDRETPHLS